MAAEFLSEVWFAELDEALKKAVLPQDAAPLVLGVEIRDTPAGTVTYAICFADGAAHLERQRADEAAVTLVEDFETARAIAEGAPVSDLLAMGRVTVRGDANSLSRAQEGLEAIAEALGAGEAASAHEGGSGESLTGQG